MDQQLNRLIKEGGGDGVKGTIRNIKFRNEIKIIVS
jgi:hypothetical protein